MKQFNRCSSILAVSLTLFSIASHANNGNEIFIVNHFDEPLNFKIGVNPAVLPDLPQTFILDVNGQISSKVIDIQKETYIRTYVSDQKSGFWGVDIENSKTHIHGYISKGIAYSWKAETIVFCTPEEYKKTGSCL